MQKGAEESVILLSSMSFLFFSTFLVHEYPTFFRPLCFSQFRASSCFKTKNFNEICYELMTRFDEAAMVTG